MATQYQVNIGLDMNTLTTLLSNGFQLYALKGVNGPPNAVPVVWFHTNALAPTNTISWQETYNAYTSNTTNLAPFVQIVPAFSAPLSPGQMLQVGAGGAGTVVNGGTPGALTVANQTAQTYTCGVSLFSVPGNQSNPICATPLFGHQAASFVPAERVCFMFATPPVNSGTVIYQAFAPGILVDMSSATVVTISFNINQGWSGPGNTMNFPANQNLVPLLINASGE